jgi:hypothetical protein
VINEEQLREMSPTERKELAHALAQLDYPHPLLELNWHRGRKFGVLLSLVSCVVLAGWIVVLTLTLHRQYTATHWRFAWVGFDIVLLVAFALTGWGFWRGRQMVIACLLVTGTLLCCDAWFDVILDLGTKGIWQSVASAAFIELPIAYVMFRAARHLIRLSTLVAMSARNDIDKLPRSLWRVPLLGVVADAATAGTVPSARREGEPRSQAGPS